MSLPPDENDTMTETIGAPPRHIFCLFLSGNKAEHRKIAAKKNRKKCAQGNGKKTRSPPESCEQQVNQSKQLICNDIKSQPAATGNVNKDPLMFKQPCSNFVTPTVVTTEPTEEPLADHPALVPPMNIDPRTVNPPTMMNPPKYMDPPRKHIVTTLGSWVSIVGDTMLNLPTGGRQFLT